MSDNARRGEVTSIQYLRGIAAVLVVAAHAADQLHDGTIQSILRSLGQGGVDIFFVISGYVMTYTEAIHGYSRSEFAKRRIARIVPLYWILTFATAALLLVAPHLARDSRFDWGDLVCSLLFIPHYNAADPMLISPMLKLGWTLNYEMIFYLAFAAVIVLRPVTRTLALTTTFGCIIAAVAYIHPTSAPPKFWGSPIILEFLFGCAIGCGDLRGLPAAAARTIWLSIFAVGTIAFLVLGAIDTTLASRLEMRGLPAALIVFSAIALERSSPIMRWNGFLHFLGEASYSIYLSHLFAIVILRALWLKVQFLATVPWHATVFTIGAMIIGTGFGCVVHIILERPMIQFVRGFATRPTFTNPSPVGNA